MVLVVFSPIFGTQQKKIVPPLMSVKIIVTVIRWANKM